MNRTTPLLIAVVVATTLVGTAAVYAFPFNKSWNEASTGVAGTNRAGAGGYFGTGGRTDKGIKCSHCHIKGPGLIGVMMTVTPAFGSANGDDQYTPGTRYTYHDDDDRRAQPPRHDEQQERDGRDHRGRERPPRRPVHLRRRPGHRRVPDGQPLPRRARGGVACPARPRSCTATVTASCRSISPHLTAWTFDWVAPAAGAGDLTLYLGMVDGDSDGSSSLNDDTLERSLPLREGP